MPNKSADSRAARNDIRIATRLAMKGNQPRRKSEDGDKSNSRLAHQQSEPIASATKPLKSQSGTSPVSARTADRKQQEKDSATAINDTLRIQRKSMSDLDAKSDGLGMQLNNIRENLHKARNTLGSAKGWLQELKDNSPSVTSSTGTVFPATQLKEALRATGRLLNSFNNAASNSKKRTPKSRAGNRKAGLALDLISGSVSILDNEKSFQDARLHGALIAKQKGIISELEKVVKGLKRDDREILAQIKDNAREKEEMEAANQSSNASKNKHPN